MVGWRARDTYSRKVEEMNEDRLQEDHCFVLREMVSIR